MDCEIEQLRGKLELFQLMHKDLNEEFRESKTICRAFNIDVDGDSDSVPGFVDLIKALEEKLTKAKSDCNELRTIIVTERNQLEAAERSNSALRVALKSLKHEDGCFCEASFSGPGCHPRHSPECAAAIQALADAPPSKWVRKSELEVANKKYA